VLALVVAGLSLFGACTVESPGIEAKAAIIDQVYTIKPNQAFIGQVTQRLDNHGFEVDVYQGDEVTVDFYQKLPSCGYKLIVFRVHSGLLSKDEEIYQGTWLFTNETHSLIKHIDQRLTQRLVKARTAENNPWVFAVGSEFITQSMQGQFDGAIIIMMGCYSLYLDDLAQAFIEQGASVYLGWDGNVDLDYVDEATIKLIENLCHRDMTIEQAVAKTMAEIGPNPVYPAELKYYPQKSSNKALSQLIDVLSLIQIAVLGASKISTILSKSLTSAHLSFTHLLGIKRQAAK